MEFQELQSLTLTREYFELLLNEIHTVFKEKHKLKELPKSSQLYGYGIFDESQPSLKNDFEELGLGVINGKYLYDKTREYHRGKPIIKLNSFYKSIVFNYIGYTDVQSFINRQSLSSSKEEEQLILIRNKDTNKTFYYLNYYFGEHKSLIKGRTIISNNWKKIQHNFIYKDEDGVIKEHHNFGNVIRREDTIHVHTKTVHDGKLVEGASEIYYIGHNDPSNINYLIGSYCTFDIYTETVAGRIILEKCASKEDMEEKAKSDTIPPYIALELRNKRIVNPCVVPRSHLELSENSPYASIYALLAGTYNLEFELPDKEKVYLDFEISPTTYKIKLITDNIYLEEDEIEFLNKGSIIHFSFKFAGIILLDSIDIYFKSHFLGGKNKTDKAVFSGIDNENKLISGIVSIKKSVPIP